MLTRRFAIFLLGIWIGCSAMLGMLVLQNPAAAESQVANPVSDAKPLIAKIGLDNSRTLLVHFIGEQDRALLANWTLAQLFIGGILVILCAFSPRKQMIPLAMGGVMTLLAAYLHFSIVPELAFLGRQADLLAPEAAASFRSQGVSTSYIYGTVEGLKLVLGGILVSYLFASQGATSSRKRRRRSDDIALEEIPRVRIG